MLSGLGIDFIQTKPIEEAHKAPANPAFTDAKNSEEVRGEAAAEGDFRSLLRRMTFAVTEGIRGGKNTSDGAAESENKEAAKKGDFLKKGGVPNTEALGRAAGRVAGKAGEFFDPAAIKNLQSESQSTAERKTSGLGNSGVFRKMSVLRPGLREGEGLREGGDGGKDLEGANKENPLSAVLLAMAGTTAKDTGGETAVDKRGGVVLEGEDKPKTLGMGRRENPAAKSVSVFVNQDTMLLQGMTGGIGERGKNREALSAGSEKDANTAGAKSRLTIVDRRTAAKAAAEKLPVIKPADLQDTRPEDSGKADKGSEFLKIRETAGPQGGGETAARNSRTITMSGNGDSFLTHLREYLNNDIVKNTGIVLKDNNAGEIKLILKPEHLGRVRIQLNLKDTHLAGRILVDNNTVKDIFEQNMNHLEQSFKENGFQTLSLEVGVGNGGRDGEPFKPFGSPLTEIEGIPALEPGLRMYLSGIGDNIIDLVV